LDLSAFGGLCAIYTVSTQHIHQTKTHTTPPSNPHPHQDLFSQYDADASGSISFDELAMGEEIAI